ncbi:MAG TPA: hypothetical protein VFA68_06115 [Terriglobales bacterium]|nr:hypothetical protein [Terriglobales bacterium]
MLPIQVRIERAQRLIDMLERDAPFLAHRFSRLAPERQRGAKEYAEQLTERARAELQKLREHQSAWENKDSVPEPAD